MDFIYLDNAATTRTDEEILTKSLGFLNTEGYYNPSALYTPARSVKAKIENARTAILTNFSSGYDLTFTSCGTEADNMAILSFGKRGNIVTSAGEHSAVYNTFMQLKQQGVEPRFAKLNKDGSINVDEFEKLIDEKTMFVSVVHVNNETGAINDINKLAKIAKQKNKNVVFHSDGVQAFLKIPYKISTDVDLYSISAHKICALKGVGALIHKKNLRLKPIIFGGGQEKNIRSGTENTLGIFCFGNAVNKFSNVSENYNNALKLKELLCKELSNDVVFISDENASPYIVSFSLPGIKAEIMQRVLESNGVIVGTGSACSAKLGTSRIISNCGLDKKIGEGVLRISFIFNTNENDVIKSAQIIKSCAQKLRMALK